MNFLECSIPSDGLICIAIPAPEPQTGFHQRFFDTFSDAQKYIDIRDAKGDTVYIAQATFKNSANRKQANALCLKNFFLDIDVGKDKPYADQQAGVDALKAFVTATRLPFPAVVSSGNGLYAHWVLEDAMPAENWARIARMLKQLTIATDFKVDQSRTADSSSILRPIGATHRKDPKNPKKVILVKEAEMLSLAEFVDPLLAAVKEFKIEKSLAVSKNATNVNDEFSVYQDITADLEKVATKCNQIGYVRSKKGDVEEPIWYSFIGLARHCIDGERLTHEWSSGHPDYSVEATNDKIEQHKNSGAGPATCAHLSELNSDRCMGCKFANKIKSPIVLGYPEPEKLAAPQQDVPEPPKPFMRTKKGVAYYDEGEGMAVVFYDEDFYPVSLQFDETLECETVTFRHHMKMEGWKEFTIKSSIVPDAKALTTALWSNHVKISGKKGKQLMALYTEGYMKSLQNHSRLAHLCSQMGWKEDGGDLAFVLGNAIYRRTDKPAKVNFSRNVPQAAGGYHTKGELMPWIELTEMLDNKEFNAYAFALCAGAFGSPLMKFTGYDGAMVALIGKTGHGKTLMQRWVQSVYGYHTDLMMYKEDTDNALVSRLGLYGSLPLTIDEISNIDAMSLSDLAYRITQGRDKARLDSSAREKTNMNRWNTLAVVSSNHSLMDRLAVAKSDASAEMNRVFEFGLSRPDAFDQNFGAKIFNTIDANYGLIGQLYINDIVKNQDKHKENINILTQKINDLAECAPEERFWAAVAAVTIYGGMIAKKLNLIKFEMVPLVGFAVEAIQSMRGDKQTMVSDAVTVIGDYLADTQGNTLVVSDTVDKRRGDEVHAVILPRGALKNRVEMDAKLIYISVTAFREWAAIKYANVGEIKKELEAQGCFFPYSSKGKKILGTGTPLAGVQQKCWVLDLKNAALGAAVVQIVKDMKEDRKAGVAG